MNSKIIKKYCTKPLQLISSILAKHSYELARVPGWRFDFADDKLNWIGKARLKIWKISLRHELNLEVLVNWYRNIHIKLTLGNDASRLIYVGGWLEPNELLAAQKILKPGMTAIDVGANEGHFSLFFASCVHPGGHVVAVEPSEREILALQRNISLNPELEVVVQKSACGDHEGEAILLIADAEHRGQNTLGSFVYDCTRIAARQKTRIFTLDQLVEQQRLQHVHFIKIDVEGAEDLVVEGARNTLMVFRPVLLLEILEPALRQQRASGAALLHKLGKLGYAILILRQQDGMWQLWHENSGVPLSENILAVPQDGKDHYLQILNKG